MSRQSLYRALVRALPARKTEFRVVRQTMDASRALEYQRALRRHKALGGALLLFDLEGTTDHFVYGNARKGMPVDEHTAFRLASISKTVTAAGIMAMRQMGLVNLDADADSNLPYSLRHPSSPDLPITLRMLLSHTAGIQDGAAYFKGIERGDGADIMLRGDSHTVYLPGQGCEYSNFGLGLAGCVVEAQTGLSFQTAMDQALFKPLGLQAAFHPHLLAARVADARRVLPPAFKPNYDGAGRQAAVMKGWESPDPNRHHLLAHGGCCMDAESLALLGRSLLKPGFFSQESLEEMTRPHGSLHSRDPYLKQGLGLFIHENPAMHPGVLYGHQGMAYGAVHMLFLDPQKGRGIISLTVGASEARDHIIADLHIALLKVWLGNG